MSFLHLHARKRVEPYPARGGYLRMLDRLVLAAGIVGPVMALPQLLLIYGTHSATGVSAFSFGAWALLDIPWIWYGFAHKERPIIVTYSLWIILNTLIALGAIMYG